MNKSNKTRKPTSLKREIGKASYVEGHSFEEKVAELFRLLHYDVEHGRLFSGRQVDLFVTTRLGDLRIQRAIECKVGTVKAEHIDSFLAKLQLVRHEYPSATGTILSASSFTDAVVSHAAKAGITLTLFRDLDAQLFDGHAYVQSLLRESKANTIYPVGSYIEPNIGYDTIGESLKAFGVIQNWLDDSEWSQLTLLGDVGTGKSFLSRMTARMLAKEYVRNPLEKPIPILVDLRHADRELSLEGLVLTHLAKNGLSQISFDMFQYVLEQGRIVLILDGFDEMAARVTPQVTNRNFHELARSVRGRAKVLLTCRTHYFKSRTEEEEVILGNRDDYGSEPARELYYELIARKGFKIAYLRPFTILQIEEYVRRVKPGSAKEAMKKIRHTYNLEELSQRPMLLEMIVKSIDKLNAGEINQATLYKVFTDAWVHRDKWRDVLSPESKLSFLTALARSLWQEDLNNIHHTRLYEYLRQELAAQIQDTQQLIEIDNEIRTASFLTRDASGLYGFAHKSYLEFFLAHHIAEQLSLGNIGSLSTRRFSSEIIQFLFFMVKRTKIEEMLKEILVQDYQPLVSENALLCLYGFRRTESLIENLSARNFSIGLPERMRLNGAQLDQVTLEGAVMIEANLEDANFEQAILTDADLSLSNLNRTNFSKANLNRAQLESSECFSTLMVGTLLEGANLSHSDFRKTDFTDAFLLEIDYSASTFNGCKFDRAVLPDELSDKLKLERSPTYLGSQPDVKGMDANSYWDFVSQLRTSILNATRSLAKTNNADEEDVASEVSFRVLRYRKLDELMKMSDRDQQAYFYTVARRLLIDQGHRQEISFGLLEDIDEDSLTTEMGRSITAAISSAPNPLDDAQAAELRRRIREMLPLHLLRTFEAHHELGLSAREIAALENMPRSTVHKRLSKAREIIKRELYGIQ